MNSTNRRQTPQGELVTKATARVQVTVEFQGCGGCWGQDCTVDQVYRQAASDALARVSRLIGQEGRIVGEPKVIAVFAEELR